MVSSLNAPVPTVSVVIPAFNAAAFVAEAIDSVLRQTHPHIEIVVVDDASEDHTADVVRPYVERGQVKLIRHASNKGLAGARNTAIRHGTGQYVAFLDVDDLWLPDHLEQALAVLERHAEVDVMFFNFDMIELATGKKLCNWFEDRRAAMSIMQTQPLEGETEGETRLITGGMLSALLVESFIHMQAVVARRAVCEQTLFDERLRRSEDIDWAIRMAHFGHGRFAFNPRVTGVYRRHINSLTSGSASSHELIAYTEWMLFREYLQWPDLAAQPRQRLRASIVKYGLELSYYARLRHDLRGALRYWTRSLTYGVSSAQLTELFKLLASAPAMLV